MSRSKETIKRVVLGGVSIIFVITAYVTFSKEKPENRAVPLPPAQTTGAAQAGIPGTGQPDGQRADAQGLDAALAAGDVPQESPFEFMPTIRDIFAVPPSGLTTTSQEAAEDEKEKDTIKNALAYKGAILHGSQAVAVINDGFFHVGDKVNGYKILSISAQEVKIDTPSGPLTLEILKL